MTKVLSVYFGKAAKKVGVGVLACLTVALTAEYAHSQWPPPDLKPGQPLTNRHFATFIASKLPAPGMTVDEIERQLDIQDEQTARLGWPIPLRMPEPEEEKPIRPTTTVRPWPDEYKLLGTYTAGTDSRFEPHERQLSAEERANRDRARQAFEAKFAYLEEEALNLPPLPDCTESKEIVLFVEGERPTSDENPVYDLLFVRGSPPNDTTASTTAVVPCGSDKGDACSPLGATYGFECLPARLIGVEQGAFIRTGESALALPKGATAAPWDPDAQAEEVEEE